MKKAKRIIILCCVIAMLSSLISASALAANLSDSSVSVGDTITFGSYEQDNNSANGTETIEWQVLDVQDGKALIISKYVLDSQSYNPERVAMTWEECNLRKWLNDEFLNAAFTAAEQEQIIPTTIQNPNNSSYGTDGGNDTTDHIFLLNIEESLNYFPSNDERVVKPTQYAFSQGAKGGADEYSSDVSCGWWLRSPGYISFSAACVTIRGAVYYQGDDVYNNSYGIRPSMWVRVAASETNAGQTNTASDSTDTVIVGDTITFGTYEQDNDLSNGAEEIEWQVLDVQDGKALIISKYALDCLPYNEEYTPTTWETSSLRTWLNSDFLNKAFTMEEQSSIVTTKISNADNAFYGTDGGNDTKDKIFLLSTDEVDQYFPVVEERLNYPTAYAFAQGAWTYDDSTENAYWLGFDEVELQEYHSDATCWTWLRSPGYISVFAMFCRNDGQVTKGGELIDVGFITVRPVLWIFLQKDASSVTSGNIEVGDTITFGTYEQDNNILNGTEEIEWDVLEVQDGKAMIISKYALDCQPYNQKYASVTWETCTLRQWLNQDFLNTAFSVEEQKKIVSTKIANDENPFYGTDGGNDTTDRVFLLSTDEIDQYFPTVEERYVYPTAYAFSQGVWTYDETSGTSYWVGYKEESLQEYHDNASCWWWLRSPGYITIFSMFCRNDGHVLKGGEINSTSFAAVRPVLWIELDEETITAVASPQTLIVDGEEKTIEMYSIYDYNYVKIRDIAALLNGTRAQFSVLYNADTRQIDISTGEPYVLIGNELTIENNPASCVTTSQTIYVNSAVQSVEMFNISGSNYIKLRDLGDLIGFKVDYSAESNQAIITST